jgi:septal ring factor EnvC (AmiA/AmiB activator)
MTAKERIPALVATVAITVALLVLAAADPRSTSAQQSISGLSSQLQQQQDHAHSLASGIASLTALIASLDRQISFVQNREAAVQAALAADGSALQTVQARLLATQARLAVLRHRLARARDALSRQLVSEYEGDKPDLIRVVLEARGFSELLEQIDFLHRAMSQQQAIIGATRRAKAQADQVARSLVATDVRFRGLTHAEALHAAALAGMDSLLHSRQAALAQARAAQRAALAAARARGARLRHAIARLQAEQAAAQQAAEQATTMQASGPALGSSAGWAIPYAIVLCESGGQNLPPNSAGASGYYQIIPSTWTSFGGSGPAAYLASKSEQDAVAARIYRGGAGVSNWDCARILGIH